MVENWKPVVGYEGLYEVSDLGRVRSLDRVVEMTNRWGGTMKRMHRGRLLRLSRVSVASDFPIGYWSFNPAKNGGAVNKMVHTAVLEAFHGPRPNNCESRHLNGDSLDNRAVNLAWGTVQENTEDKDRHGRIYRGDAAPGVKLTEARIAQAKFLVGHGMPLKYVAKRLEVHPKRLSSVLVKHGFSVGRGQPKKEAWRT